MEAGWEQGVAGDYLLLGKEIISEPTTHNLHLLVGPQLRKKVGRINPLINMGDRKGALKGLKVELGGYEGAIDGENQGRGEVAHWNVERLVVVTLTWVYN